MDEEMRTEEMSWDASYEETVRERFALVTERIGRIAGMDEAGERPEVPERFAGYFKSSAEFLLLLAQIYRESVEGRTAGRSMEECEKTNARLYAEILPGMYEKSYLNPSYAVEMLGEEYGRHLSMLSDHFRKNITEAFRGCLLPLVAAMELFVEIYNYFEAEGTQDALGMREFEQDIYSYVHDYSEVFVESGLRRLISPAEDYYTRLVMEADLTDLTYLYRYGLYIGENEKGIASFLNSLSGEQIQAMADTYTEGYRIGFEVTGKDLGKKQTVQIRYPVGFERMVRCAIRNFEKMNLKPTMQPSVVPPNRQYEYDHKEDRALYLDKPYIERCLEVTRNYLESEKELAEGMAGPAVIEVFGEEPFSPQVKTAVPKYSEEQQKLCVYEMNMQGQLMNHYLKGEERSFTIIAYPVPAIGEHFAEIFAETVKINTLDYSLYQRIQQSIIDVLDQAKEVRITGAGENRTDLTVAIRKLADPGKETAFENCVADVNIPVGEVFTSPVLAGTTGKLFVSKVYLRGLKFLDLEIDFEDGMTTNCTCSNFATEEENQKYVRDNVLMRHDALPMGEFAIGTNTTAYRMAQKYAIADKLPILIAEKTGPHFAVGDTCYSHEEDNISRNPDGKVIVAKENAVSAQRGSDPDKAYFNCHTDITIPYDELGRITVVREDGTMTDIIADGRFVLPGTEELNQPLDA